MPFCIDILFNRLYGQNRLSGQSTGDYTIPTQEQLLFGQISYLSIAQIDYFAQVICPESLCTSTIDTATSALWSHVSHNRAPIQHQHCQTVSIMHQDRHIIMSLNKYRIIMLCSNSLFNRLFQRKIQVFLIIKEFEEKRMTVLHCEILILSFSSGMKVTHLESNSACIVSMVHSLY